VSRDFDSIRPDRSSGDGFAVDVHDGGFAIFSHGGTPMSLFDPKDGRILEVNEAWIERYGYSRDEAHQMRVQDVSAEPDATSDAVKRAEVTGGAQINVRWHRTKAGQVFPVEVTSGTLRIGPRTLMYAVMHDIEPRLDSEKRLQRSERRLRALVESLPIGIVVHRRGTILYANQGLREMLALEPDEDLVGTPIMGIVHPDDRDEVAERVAAVASQGLSTPAMQGRLMSRAGTPVAVEVTGIPFDYDGEPAVLAMLLDLRKRKQMEAQLVLADRLASLGRLAASVGHEINNPLAYLLGNIELLERELGAADGLDDRTRKGVLERLAVLQEGALRVRDIVRDLKTLTSGEPEKVEGAELHRVLDICVHMAEREILQRAKLRRDYSERVSIAASEQRLGQVFLNLLINAAESINQGGPDENEVQVISRLLPPDQVEVLVCDTGDGIPPSLRDRVFEPFFTTKSVQGTGLGLAICHSLVTAMGGTITIEPREPRGTCFRVVLPRHEASR
jgi:two-component system NtrC family sensor kinase